MCDRHIARFVLLAVLSCPCSVYAQSPHQIAIVVLGQSNATNEASIGSYVARNGGCRTIDMRDGAITVAADPVVPYVVGNFGGSFMPRLCDLLIATGRWSKIILAPIAVGGTYSADWAPGGTENPRIGEISGRLSAAGIETGMILWQHGEGDANVTTVTQAQYVANVRGVQQTFHRTGIDAPFFVPRETICNIAPITQPVNSKAIGAAQAQLVDNVTFFAGPDFDTLDSTFREDGCHFNGTTGTPTVASMWSTAITAAMR